MRVLVAGATGNIGTELLGCLAERGHWIRALTRRPRARDWLEREADEVTVIDAAQPMPDLGKACAGVDVVFSAIGQSTALGRRRCRRSFDQIDTRANLALLDAARTAGVERFVYVSVFAADEARESEYVAAHERVVDAILASGLDSCIVRPTRLFASYLESLPGSRAAPRAPLIGNGSGRSNPIHEFDVARSCVEAIEGDVREIAVGGPEALTREDEAALLADALSWARPVRRLSPGHADTLGRLLRPFDARRGALLRYRAATATASAIAPVRGEHALGDYLVENAPR